MKTKFENLVKEASLMRCNALSDGCIEIADDLKDVSTDMFSMSKRWWSYGTWISTAYANSYYFGDVLSELIVKACTGIVTHDEEKEFCHDDIRELVADYIFDHIYNMVVYS